MAPRVPRRFNLRDAMVLVAATAPGMAYPIWLSRGRTPMWVILSSHLIREWWMTIWSLGVKLMPLLACWTFAFLVLRLWQPRPSLRRVMLQPGMTAGCAAAVSIGMISIG
ncbi:MAG TPA: hypothetical protein VGZ22_21970, partial [Isosphaeraceae bacterium]|nr:hypothetical protein [Isosphaeraceae bacterium]